jgi:hypothetical protein
MTHQAFDRRPERHLKAIFEVASDGGVTHSRAVDGKTVISASLVGSRMDISRV